MALPICQENRDFNAIPSSLHNIANLFESMNRVADAHSARLLSYDLVIHLKYPGYVFKALLNLFFSYAITGAIAEAEVTWSKLNPMGRSWHRNIYSAGEAEYWYAVFQFCYFDLREKDLTKAEKLARLGHSRSVTRGLLNLRGRWHLDRGEIVPTIDSLRETVRLSRSAGLEAPESEALLALARLRGGDRTKAHEEAERLSAKPDECALTVARLWQALGEPENALERALRAHRWAVADGEPYVRRWDLNQTRALLTELGAELPPVPQYDPATRQPFPWEEHVRAAIEELRAGKEHEKAKGKHKRSPRR